MNATLLFCNMLAFAAGIFVNGLALLMLFVIVCLLLGWAKPPKKD